MLGITDLPTYLLGTIAIVLLPGPNSLFVLATAARRGVSAGYRAAGGVLVGDAVLMVLSAAGLASVLRAYPPLFIVIKYAGAGYLCYMGLGMLRGAWRRWRGRKTAARVLQDHRADGGVGPAAHAPGAGPFRRSLTISLLNPKAILFFVSFFIQFVDPDYPYPALSFLVLGTVAQVISILYLSALIFGSAFLVVAFRRRRRLSATVTTGLGALFVGFGIKLATASL